MESKTKASFTSRMKPPTKITYSTFKLPEIVPKKAEKIIETNTVPKFGS